MQRKQPLPPRRHSLPVPSNIPTVVVGQARSFPEGTETFQKALEDLYISDLTQPFIRYQTNGLKEIEEGDEDEYSSDDSEKSGVSKTNSSLEIHLPTPPLTSGPRMDRRHSLPGRLFDKDTDKDMVQNPVMKKASKKSGKTLMKDHSQNMKDYFIKHGHWPSGAHAHSSRGLKAGQNDYKKVSPRQANKSRLSTAGKSAASKS